MTEPIASSTLALLYLAQGHRSRARATLDEVLAAEPDNGYALALADRMQPRPRPQLRARFVASSAAGIDIGAGELELSWSIPPALADADAQLHVVVALATRGRASLRYTSIACADARGTQRIPAPLGPASAAVSLVANKPGARLRLICVVEPTSW